MAITLVNSVSAGATGGSLAVTTAADSMTGASFIVCPTSYKITSAGNKTVTDSQSNTYVNGTENSQSSDVTIRYATKDAPSVSGTQTFTLTVDGGVSLPSIAAAGFSGTLQPLTLDGTATGSGSAGVTSKSTGSLTTTTNGALVVAAIGIDRAVTGMSVDNGFTIIEQVEFSSGNCQFLCFAYLIQGAAGAISCTFSWTTAANVAARIFAVKAATTAAVGPLARFGHLGGGGILTGGRLVTA